jgi:pimeloyl-ACP methyl ester carboxylesterase
MALDGDGVRAFLGDPADMRPDLDPARGTPLIPVTVLHGGDDTLVPIAQARAYRDAVGSATVRELPGVGHFALIDPLTPAFDELLTALAPAGIE